MDELRNPGALADLVTRHVVPLAGVLFLGWPAGNIMVLLALDTLLTATGLGLLVMIHITGLERDREFGGTTGAQTNLNGTALRPAPVVEVPQDAPAGNPVRTSVLDRERNAASRDRDAVWIQDDVPARRRCIGGKGEGNTPPSTSSRMSWFWMPL